MLSQLNKMKKSIGFTSETEIDERIASLEFKLRTDNISLKEEKEMLKEMQELKRHRPKVPQVDRMEDSLQNRDSGRSYKEQIEVINQQVAVFKEATKRVNEENTALMDGRKEQMGDLPKIFISAIEEVIRTVVRHTGSISSSLTQTEREHVMALMTDEYHEQ